MLIALVVLSGNVALAQNQKPAPKDSSKSAANIVTRVDSLTIQPKTDTVKLAKKKSDIKTTVKYFAADSMRFDVQAKTFYLYSKSKVEYGDVSLTASKINVNWQTNLVNASPGKDSSGKDIDMPVLLQGSEKYQARKMKYNFKSKKAIIQELVTQQGEGYIHSESVKKDSNNVMCNLNGIYTTCNLEHPHFFIASTKIKMIPNKKLITGPFNLWIEDIPTPLGFAFGMFPTPKTKTAGIIFPTYGESADRGFFLRNGGWYMPIGDFMGLKILGEIYTKGSWGVNVFSDYKKRYGYDGNLELRFNRRKFGQEGFETIAEDSWFAWSHTPQSFGQYDGRFSANVNLGSQNYNRRNSFEENNFLSTNFQSSVQYSKVIQNSPFSYNISLRQNQNVTTGIMNLTLPNVAWNMNRLYPFRRENSLGNAWYEKINLAWSMSADNQSSNIVNSGVSLPGGIKLYNRPSQTLDTIPITLGGIPEIIRRGRNGIQHSIPISTTFSMLKYINVSPSISYSEVWYGSKLGYTFIADSNAVKVDTVRQFSRASRLSGGVSATTRFYGIFYVRKGRVEAIRQTVIPTASFTYTPDLSGALNQLQEITVDTAGRGAGLRQRTVRLNPFANGIYGGPGTSRSGLLSFSLQNSFEMKLKAKEDTGKKVDKSKPKFEKKMLLDNFSLSGSYDIYRDSLRLSPINLSLFTRLFDKLQLSAGGTLDPYALEDGGRNNEGIRRKFYAWNEGQGIGRLTSANVALNTNFSAKSKKPKTDAKKGLNAMQDAEMAFIAANPNLFVDFNVPWNINIMYNLSWAKPNRANATVTQTLSFSGDVSITEKWKVGASSAYDFELKRLGYTNLNIYRDLHCWEMRINWVPFGIRQSYSVDINVKAASLRDLKLSRRRNWYDR